MLKFQVSKLCNQSLKCNKELAICLGHCKNIFQYVKTFISYSVYSPKSPIYVT